MATQPQLSSSPATQRHYLAQLALTAALIQALRNLWPAANPLRNEGQFREAVFVLVQQFGQMAASMAGDFYRDVRTEAGVTGALRMPTVPLPPRSLVNAGIDYAKRAEELVAAKQAEAAQVEQMILDRVERTMQKAVADVAREQTVAAVEGDAFAMGFHRVPRPGACYFCIAMAVRTSTRTRQKLHGKFVHDQDVTHLGVYKTRASAGAAANRLFDGDGEAKFHNNCHCVIEPVFFAAERAPEDWLVEMADLYDTFDPEKYGTGLAGFRRALEDFRNGHTFPTPTAPVAALPAAATEQINALLDLIAKAA